MSGFDPLKDQIVLYSRLFGAMGIPYALLGRWRPGRICVCVRPPKVRRSVWIRPGSSDVRCYRSVFRRKQYSVGLRPRPKVIVDAGANIGLSAVYFAQRYRSARILAVEPEASNFALLERNIRRFPRITPVRAALWRTNEPLTLRKEMKSFDSFRIDGPARNLSEAVPGKTLDRLMDEHGIDRIDLLKVDIEGAEREIFADASAWIDRVDAMFVEVHEFLRADCEEIVRKALSHFEYYGRKSIHVFAVRDVERISRMPRGYEPSLKVQ